MGANGISVSAENDLQSAIKEAIDSGRPSVVQVHVDSLELGDPFRRDAMRYPVRHLDKYAHLGSDA